MTLEEMVVEDPDSAETGAPERRSLTHDTLWSVLATGSRTVSAVAIFWALARNLGEERYGLYAAALALFLILGSFVTLGTPDIVVKRVSRDRAEAQAAWGASLAPGVLLSFLMAGLLGALAEFSVPGMDGNVVFVLGLAEFLGVAVTAPASYALQALDRYPEAAFLTILWAGLRVAFLGFVFLGLDETTLMAVGLAILAASVISGLADSLVLGRIVGRPHFSASESIRICKEGSPFSLTQASGVLLGDIDKQMLIRLDATPQFSTGIYAAGHRVLGLAATPLNAVLSATYPRFFAKGGEEGLRGTWEYAKKLMKPVTAYAVLAGAGLFVVAPLVDDILGSGYSDSINVIRWMTVVPIIHLPALLAAEALTGAGFQGTRNRFIIGAGVVNVVLNLALISTYGVTGAIVATYASEFFLLGGLLNWIRTHLDDPVDTSRPAA